MTIADPVDLERVRSAALDAAFAELREGVLADAPAPRRRRRLPRVRFTLAATAVAALAFLVVTYGPWSDRQSGTAYAERFADASPLVLLGADGWRVSYVDESSEAEGELHFARPGESIERFPAAQLDWYDEDLEERVSDRASGDGLAESESVEVLNTTARVFAYPGGRDFEALFAYDDRVLAFRARVSGLDEFVGLLTSLERVDSEAWLAAMPAGAVTFAERAPTVDAMLEGIPLPPGFDAAPLKEGDAVRDRYQLGAEVVGAVVCGWFTRWGDGIRAGDERVINKARSALQTARRWPILIEMTQSGDYPRILWQDIARVSRSGMLGDWSGGTPCGG